MTTVAALVLALLGIALLLPTIVLLGECAAACFPARPPNDAKSIGRRARVVVLIPAYNEAKALGTAFDAIFPQLGSEDRVLVVADNCTDDTAEVAGRAGAEVLERYDPRNRGKGYALDAGIAHLAANPPDVVVVVDADCRVSPGSIRNLADIAMSTGRPAQAQDLLTVPAGASPLARVSAFAFLVKNQVRPMGLTRLGLPCQLMGTGMAFPWHVIKKAPPAGSHLAEDVQMGIELATLGFAPVFCPQASISSAPPKRARAARGQHRRWEHGHISTLIDTAPRLIWRGISRRQLHVLTLGLDVLVPPLALFVIVLLLDIVASYLLVRANGSAAPLVLGLSALAFVTIAVFLAWFRFGRATCPARYLLMVPTYVIWKLPLYLSFTFRGPQATWERTERSASGF